MPVSQPPSEQDWAPKPLLVGLAWLIYVIALVITLFAAEPATRLLWGCGAALFLAISLYGTFIRPRLRADAAGITVRTLTGSQHLAWEAADVQLVITRRWGREVSNLEIAWQSGSTERLVVLTMVDLGADPHDVSDTISELRNQHSI